MNAALHDHAAPELDAKNRAAQYFLGAQQQTELQQQHVASRQSTEFQHLLWLRYAEQSHEMNLQRERHRQALELELQKHHASLELKRVEAAQHPRMGVLAAPKPPSAEGFWQSKLLLTILTISLPIILTALLRPRQAKPDGFQFRTSKLRRRRNRRVF